MELLLEIVRCCAIIGALSKDQPQLMKILIRLVVSILKEITKMLVFGLFSMI